MALTPNPLSEVFTAIPATWNQFNPASSPLVTRVTPLPNRYLATLDAAVSKPESAQIGQSKQARAKTPQRTK
jgi:hypothetical protein